MRPRSATADPIKTKHIMKIQATFYHAGCPVCVSAEHAVTDLIDRSRYDLSIVHPGKDRSRLGDAEHAWKVLAMLLSPSRT